MSHGDEEQLPLKDSSPHTHLSDEGDATFKRHKHFDSRYKDKDNDNDKDHDFNKGQDKDDEKEDDHNDNDNSNTKTRQEKPAEHKSRGKDGKEGDKRASQETNRKRRNGMESRADSD